MCNSFSVVLFEYRELYIHITKIENEREGETLLRGPVLF